MNLELLAIPHVRARYAAARPELISSLAPLWGHASIAPEALRRLTVAAVSMTGTSRNQAQEILEGDAVDETKIAVMFLCALCGSSTAFLAPILIELARGENDALAAAAIGNLAMLAQESVEIANQLIGILTDAAKRPALTAVVQLVGKAMANE